jgi:SAM-dependent methyltransferase
MTDISSAYSAGAAAWSDGPTRVYRRLAELLVQFSPAPVAGRLVLDLGSGTGVGSHALRAAGARVVAADLAIGMLLTDRTVRPPATVGDAQCLPFRDGAFDIVLAPFCLNHLGDPSEGVRESGRVGDLLVGSTYAVDDDHPAKAAVEIALGELGWQRPAWYSAIKVSMSGWGTVADATAVVERGGMRPIAVERREIAYPDLGPEDMVAWRMGLPHTAAFVAGLDPGAQHRVFDRALDLLGHDPEPIVRRVILFAARRP